MAFLAGSQVFLFLRRDDLYVFFKTGKTKQIVFPQTALNNLEVVDKKLFEKILREFFSSWPGQKGVLFLSHSVVFDKIVDVGAETIPDDELKKFVNTIPLQPGHVATKIIRTRTRTFLFGANGDIYETIIAIVGQYGWQIKYVVPLALFDKIIGGAQVSYGLFCRALKEKKLLGKGNFLVNEESKEIKKVPLRQYLMLGLSLLSFVEAVLLAGYNFHFFPFSDKTQTKQEAVITPTKPIVLTPTPVTTEVTAPQREDIKIQILNGSGVAGQASAIKDQLEALGYVNVETGNAEGPMSNATIVIFSDNVGEELQDEILMELKKTFASVEAQSLPVVEGFDVSITTGEVL